MSSKPSRSRRVLRSGVILAAILIPAWTALCAAEAPRRVADLNTQPVNDSAFAPPYTYLSPETVVLGGVAYFAATDPMHGLELWRSDGTAEGTRLVRDIRPGTAGSNLNSLVVHQGRLYFFADDGVWGLELWSSDGTREGTRLVRNVCEGSCLSGFRAFVASAGSFLYFAGGSYGARELWRTDGTREGTHQVPIPCSECFSLFDGGFLGLPSGRILFTAYDPQKGQELWMSDGTPEGTLGLDLLPGANGSYPSGFFVTGDRAFFWAVGETGEALWVSDGTAAGTRSVRNSSRPASDSGPVEWKGGLYYANLAGELWRTDLSSGRSVRLAQFETGFNPFESPYRPVRLTPLPDRLLFIAGDSVRGLALWQTRGTRQTTGLLKDVAPGEPLGDLADLHRVGSRAFFVARTVEGPVDLWKSDGTAEGTRRITTLCQDAEGCFAADPRDYTGVRGLSLFVLRTPLVGRELWRSDGSAAGTFLVRDIHKGGGSAVLGEIAALDGRALFGASTAAPSAGPAALWSSDGTAAGTALVDGESPWPQDFVRQGDHLYFSGALSEPSVDPHYLRRQGLWRTDGTTGGTERLADLFDLDLLAVDGGLLFLRAGDEENSTLEGTGIELWRSDGTPAGTRLVADVDQQPEVGQSDPPLRLPGSSLPGPLVRLGPVLLYAADDGLTGRELWATDGTEAGTRKVRDINGQDRGDGIYFEPGASNPDSLVRLGGVVLFAADDGLSGRELWVTDGTEAGTRRLRDLRRGAGSSAPHDLVELGGAVYFFASAVGSGEALWRTDGTEAGTVPVKSLARQGLPSWGRDLTRAGGRLFFVADNEAIGSELHVSDGTPAGTRLVRQIRPGVNGSYPQAFKVVDGLLFFAADDGAHGLEPWRSAGTAAGTYPLGDLAPGPAASSPSAFTGAGSLLFFAADDGAHGRELWTMPLEEAAPKGDLP